MDAVLRQLNALEQAREKLHTTLRKAEFALSVARRVEEGRGVLLSIDAVPAAPNSLRTLVYLHASFQKDLGNTPPDTKSITNTTTNHNINNDDNSHDDTCRIRNHHKYDNQTNDALSDETNGRASSLASAASPCSSDAEQKRGEVNDDAACVSRWELRMGEYAHLSTDSRLHCIRAGTGDSASHDEVATTTHRKSSLGTPQTSGQLLQDCNECGDRSAPLVDNTARESSSSSDGCPARTHSMRDSSYCSAFVSQKSMPAILSTHKSPELMFSTMPSPELRECQAHYRAALNDILATVQAQAHLMEKLKCYDGGSD